MFSAAPTSAPALQHTLLAHLMIFNICKLPEAATPRGKQKGLSVEGGKTGSGWGHRFPGDTLNWAPPGEEDATHSSPFPHKFSRWLLGICRNLADPNVYAKDSQESETL